MLSFFMPGNLRLWWGMRGGRKLCAVAAPTTNFSVLRPTSNPLRPTSGFYDQLHTTSFDLINNKTTKRLSDWKPIAC